MSSGNLLHSFFDVRKGERLKTALLFAWLFLVICVYYVLRPIRRGMVLEALGNDKMPFVYMGTALVTAVVVWIYSRFAHLPRRTLISGIYGIFFVNLVGWWFAFQHESPITSGLFWVWLDVFSIMAVTLFWMYANDVYESSDAKRIFGIIAAGAGLGAVLGSSLTATLVGTLGATNMLLVAAGIVLLTMAIFLILEKTGTATSAERKTSAEFKEFDPNKFVSVLKTIFTNKFLCFLVLLVCCERGVPDIVQFVYHDVLTKMATGRDAIAALDANLERWRSIIELIVELFLVSAVLQKLGTRFALTANSWVIGLGLTCFAFIPNPIIVLAVFHSDEGMRHAWFKAAKELTYTVTSREVLYSIKPVIEMFFYRFSRGLAGLSIYLTNTVFGLGTNGVLALGVIAASGWCYCGWRLNEEFRRLEAVNALAAVGTPRESEPIRSAERSEGLKS